MLGTMAEQTRVLAYDGLYRSQAEDRFQADAVEAARYGWYPTTEQWLGGTLVVTYAHGKGPRRAAPADGMSPGRSRPSALRLLGWLVACVVVVPVLTFVSVALLNLSQHGSIIAP